MASSGRSMASFGHMGSFDVGIGPCARTRSCHCTDVGSYYPGCLGGTDLAGIGPGSQLQKEPERHYIFTVSQIF